MPEAVGCVETLAVGVRVGEVAGAGAGAGAIRLADRGTSGFPMRSFTDDSTCREHIITLRVSGSVTITSSTHKLPMHHQLQRRPFERCNSTEYAHSLSQSGQSSQQHTKRTVTHCCRSSASTVVTMGSDL